MLFVKWWGDICSCRGADAVGFSFGNLWDMKSGQRISGPEMERTTYISIDIFCIFTKNPPQ